MIAAVYARKSTEQTGVADDQKSVARQVEHASTYARTKGWTVAPASVFVDDALAARQFVIRVRAEIEGLPSGGIVSGAATGGLVGRGRVIPFALGGPVFSPMGTDTVPAMLTPGEIVLNAAQQRRVAGAMGGSITLNVSVDASGNDPDAVARKVSDAIMMKLRREQRLTSRSGQTRSTIAKMVAVAPNGRAVHRRGLLSMIWFFERGTQAVRLETRYDKGAQEYTVLITWSDTSTNMERYASFDAYHARILSLEQQLEAEQWRLAGAPTLIASDWPGP